jgi:hypothetical protein
VGVGEREEFLVNSFQFSVSRIGTIKGKEKSVRVCGILTPRFTGKRNIGAQNGYK